MSEVAENWKRLQERIAEAARGRAVTIAGAAKDQPTDRVRDALNAGLRVIAMNYQQQGEQLRAELAASVDVEWHFIGHIQSRKAKLLTWYDCVQSLDRIEVARALNDRRSDAEPPQAVLVEINIGNEPQKSGIAVSELASFLEQLAALPRLRVAGLMGMPPPLPPIEARRPYFRQLKALFERFGAQYGFRHLSMGTSEDFLIAVEEGSTMVRLGTRLFGART